MIIVLFDFGKLAVLQAYSRLTKGLIEANLRIRKGLHGQ